MSEIEYIDYSPEYDEDYLNSLIEKAKGRWKDIDVDDWLDYIRGEVE